MKILEEQIPELIRNQQDRDVIKHLYKELFPVVRGYIRKNNGVEDDAYDVFQDAILYFYNQVVNHTFDSKYNVYGYIYRIAINRWFNKLKKDKRVVFGTDMDDALARNTSDLIDETIESEKQDKNIITKFISEIGEKCVELLTMRIYGDVMFEDIVIRMGFNSQAAAKMYFKRCQSKLVEAIKSDPVLVDQLRQR